MCVACYVDEAAKDKIIAYSAKFHEVTQSPYGSDDEIGMLHSSTASLAGHSEPADASKMCDLSVDNSRHARVVRGRSPALPRSG